MKGKKPKSDIIPVLVRIILGRSSFKRTWWMGAGMAICIASLTDIAFKATVAESLPATRQVTGLKAQTGSDRFEAVSIRQLNPSDRSVGVGRGGGGLPGGGGCGGNPPRITPGRIVFGNTRIFAVIAWAYGFKCGEASKVDLISGAPPWVKSDQFVIQATFPENSNVRPPADELLVDSKNYPQVQMMLRSLLVDRFKLAFHREKREVPAYELILAKGGPKLTTEAKSDELKRALGLGAQAWSVGPVPIDNLVTFLQDVTGRTISDRTGLTGKYHFDLYFLGIDQSPPNSNFPSLFTALQEQLGLKLQESKTLTDAIIIDQVERPTID
jgi:uncharacterized protein (TIGR03435 family)